MKVIDLLAIIISTLAFFVSSLTAWLTFFKRGKLKMTQPTPFLLNYENKNAKISFFTVLYCSAFRGLVVENMYIILRQNNRKQSFNRWVYKKESQALASGCFVNPEGMAQNHQFYCSDENFKFETGHLIRFEIYATIVAKNKPIFLKSIVIKVPSSFTDSDARRNGIMFEWEPDKREYCIKL